MYFRNPNHLCLFGISIPKVTTITFLPPFVCTNMHVAGFNALAATLCQKISNLIVRGIHYWLAKVCFFIFLKT